MDCNNGFNSKDEFEQEFGKDEILDKCNGCPNLTYDGELILCKKFS